MPVCITRRMWGRRMDRRELLDKTARSEEERLLLSRVWDKREQCRLRNIPTATAFLSPQEQAAATRLLNAPGRAGGLCLLGAAMRARSAGVCCSLPDWMAGAGRQRHGGAAGGMRQRRVPDPPGFLGSLMALGLTREKIGDILVESGGCQVLVDPSPLDFLTQSWDSAGRERLTVSPPAAGGAHRSRGGGEGGWGHRILPCGWTTCWPSGFSLSRGRAAEAVERARGAGELHRVPEAG